MSPVVDILVANWNTLPWLRLLTSQIRRLQPSHPHRVFLWDNASSDGSSEWLAQSGYDHVLSPVHHSHAASLTELLKRSQSPYVAFMDVDAIPVHGEWLDEALALAESKETGAVGLRGGCVDERHRHFVHPSFCVLRRELFGALDLRLDIVTTGVVENDLDVGEAMSAKLQNAGYILRFKGNACANIDELSRGVISSKVFHLWSSTPVLSVHRNDPEWDQMLTSVIRGHRYLLGRFGLWAEFEKYAREALDRNPLCARYL